MAHAGAGEVEGHAGLASLGRNEFFLLDQIVTETIGDDFEIGLGNLENARAFLTRAGGRGVERHDIERGVVRAFDLDDAAVDGEFADGRLVLVERDISLEASLDADHRADEERDDAVVGDDETGVRFCPWPAGDRDGKEVDAENDQPNDEPRGLVDINLCDFGAELGLRDGGDRAGGGDRGDEDQSELQRAQPMNHAPHGRAGLALFDEALALDSGQETHLRAGKRAGAGEVRAMLDDSIGVMAA